jgi:hypothetical protein
MKTQKRAKTLKKKNTDVSIQSFRDGAPRLPKILFAVLGEKSCEGGLFEKRAALVVHLGKLVELPLLGGKPPKSTPIAGKERGC